MPSSEKNKRPLVKWLTVAEAAAYLKVFDEPFREVGNRIGMDVDPELLSSGRSRSGAGLFEGGRCDEVLLAEPRGSTFIDGDLIVDGPIENDGGLVFVKGDLVGRSLFNCGYLVVAGDLRVERFFGEDEPLGTYVFGDASIATAVLSHNHHFDVWGDCVLEELVDGEDEGSDAVHERLEEWGVLDPGAASETESWIDAARRGLVAWARSRGPLREE